MHPWQTIIPAAASDAFSFLFQTLSSGFAKLSNVSGTLGGICFLFSSSFVLRDVECLVNFQNAPAGVPLGLRENILDSVDHGFSVFEITTVCLNCMCYLHDGFAELINVTQEIQLPGPQSLPSA
jgi:hypothetical protein